MNEREKITVSKMIRIYCRFKHGTRNELCPDCKQLEDYAHKRLEHCRFGEEKPACEKCPVHCYKPECREKIREVMRFAGPRMVFFHPVEAVRHLWGKKAIRDESK